MLARSWLVVAALLALGTGSAAASAVEAPVGFAYDEGGYELSTPAGTVDVAKGGYLLIVDYAPGGVGQVGDGTISVQNTLSFLDATVNTRDNPYFDGPEAPVALDASLRSLSAPNPAFALLREVDAGILDRTGGPVELYVGDDGVDLGWDLPGSQREAGEVVYPYPDPENSGMPVDADADSVGLAPSWGESTDHWLEEMDRGVIIACGGASQELGVQDGGLCEWAAAFDDLRPLLPNVVFHSELQDLGFSVNPADPGDATLHLPLPGLGQADASDGVGAKPLLGPVDEALPALDDALPIDAPALRAEPPSEGEGVGIASSTLGAPGQDNTLLMVLALAAGAGLALLAVPLYRRIVRGKLLENDVRGRILALVQARPGLHESAVAKGLGISHTLAQYHVRMLAEFGLVEVRRFGGRKCLFAAGQMGRTEKTMLLAEQGRSAQVVDLVAAQPGIAQRELARALGIRESSVKWHLDRLEQAGVVAVERTVEGKRVRLTAEAEGARLATFTRVAPEAVPPAIPAGPSAPTPAAAPAQPAEA